MVTRGLPLPNVKRMYIVRDAKREADRLGIPFGEICDPLGTGVDNCIAIAHWANAARRSCCAFAKSAMRGIWAEARDMAEYVDLRYVVERAGLPWAEAKAAIGDAEAARSGRSQRGGSRGDRAVGRAVVPVRRASSRGARIACRSSPIGCAGTRLANPS